MLTRALTRERVAPGAGVLGNDHPWFTFVSGSGAERRLDEPRLFLAMPAPVIPEPEGLQQVQRRGVWPAIDGADAGQCIVWGPLGILDEYIEVAVLGKNPGAGQTGLCCVLCTPAFGADYIMLG